MAPRRAVEQRYWTLVANPTKYRITDAIMRLDRDWWTRDRSDIRIGDGIAIWKTRGAKGAGRGVIALGRVVDGPVDRADKDNPFHLDVQRAREVLSRVAVSYVPIRRPLWDDGEHRQLISSLRAWRARGSTVLTLAPDEWHALKVAALEGEDIEHEEKPFAVIERKRYRQHRRIERNSTAAVAVKRSRGFRCEACGFAFEDMYGDLGSQFIEVHHLRPLASLDEDAEVEYRLDDFAALCSNCHRMIHRRSDPADLDGLVRDLRRRWD